MPASSTPDTVLLTYRSSGLQARRMLDSQSHPCCAWWATQRQDFQQTGQRSSHKICYW